MSFSGAMIVPFSFLFAFFDRMIKEWWDYTLLMRASIATRVNFIMESVERPSCEPRGAQVIIIVSVAAPGVSHSGHLY